MHQAHPLSTLTADPSFPEQFNLSRKLWSIPSVAVATNIWLCEDDSDMQGDKRRILTHYGSKLRKKRDEAGTSCARQNYSLGGLACVHRFHVAAH